VSRKRDILPLLEGKVRDLKTLRIHLHETSHLFSTKRSMGTTIKFKHHSLTGRITSELLAKAFKSVKRNKGAAGVDRVSIEQYEKNLGLNLAELMRLMKQRGRYHPKPNRRVWIPKTIKRQKNPPMRPLGIPGVRDRTEIFWRSSANFSARASSKTASSSIPHEELLRVV